MLRGWGSVVPLVREILERIIDEIWLEESSNVTERRCIQSLWKYK